jgi:exodeoxyribonuclease VII large subunit
MQDFLSFPEPDETKPAKTPWTVSRLNREVRHCLEGRIGAVWVEGEVSNLRRQPSGHQYFSLKDDAAQVSCVLFRSAASGASTLRDGTQVELFGDLSVYEPRGQYQVIVRRVQARGTGELEARLRALQEKLRAEGLFDHTRKKTLPPHPARVGVVTSPAGAAIRDFLHVLARRAPHIAVCLAPVRVQGRGAATEIAAAVDAFATPERSGFPRVDVIVVTRGGGSLEDLWEFNEEIVARAIAASSIPVISAVGHETDTTTSDLVADVRAPTPSAAAEILSADQAQTLEKLTIFRRRLAREAARHLQNLRNRLELVRSADCFRQPYHRLHDWRQVTDDLQSRSTEAVLHRLAAGRLATRHAQEVLQARSPQALLRSLREQLSHLTHRQELASRANLLRRQEFIARHRHALELLGPRQTLSRGFTITLDQQRRPLTSAAAAAQQTTLTTVFADGEVASKTQP